jgi:hypothetical protein
MIVACYKVINENLWLKTSIDSVYPFVDKIVIVEGCDSFMKRAIGERVTEEGLSVDGTTEMIKSYPDERGIINHIPLGFIEGDESELWNTYINECKVGDWCWSIDGDEVYSESQARKMVELMKSEKYETIRINLHNLWHDIEHRIIGGGWFTKHERAVKIVEEGIHYKMLSDARLKDGRDVSTRDKNYYDEEFFLVHFSYIRDRKKMLEKMCWQLRMYEKWDTHPKWHHARESFKSPEKYLQKNHVWFTDYIEEGHEVIDYEVTEDIKELLRKNKRLDTENNVIFD